MTELKPQDVLDAFGKLTGITFRLIPHNVQRQAAAFAKVFTLDDLELVVLWTKRQIHNGAKGFSTASLQWRTLFGDHGAADEFCKFQERLGLAEQYRRRGWRPKFTLGVKEEQPTTKEPEKKAEKVGEVVSEKASAHVQEWLQSMRGGAG